MTLSTWYHSLLNWLERRLTSPYWLWILTFWCAGLSIFLAFPPYSILYRHLHRTGFIDAWNFIEIQSHDLLHPTHLEVYIRRENMVFRWFLPMLSYLTNHNIVLILVLQALLGLLFLYFSVKLFYQFSNSKTSTALFGLAIANVLSGSVAFIDVQGYGDAFALFFLMACLVSRNSLVILLCLFSAYLVDERALLASGFVCLWWITQEYWKSESVQDSFGKVLSALLKTPTWVVIVSWILYFAARFYIKAHYFPNHSYSTMGTPVLFANAHRFGLGSSLWGAFEGMWLLIGAAFLMLWSHKRYYLLALLAAGVFLLIVSGIYVHDIDRALAYGFPFFLIAGFILFQSVPLREFRLLVFFTALVCTIHPLVFTMGYNRIIWAEPLPVKAAMLLDRLWGWGYFD